MARLPLHRRGRNGERRVSLEAALRAAAPEDVATLMRRIHAHGFAVYVVGGAVRDVLAGRTPTDWDLATDATPDQLRAAFPDAQYENRFGTVGIPTAAGVREVTTFRTDGPSSDARRPDAVDFIATIEGDLARRDFTINAMAFGLARGEVGDPVSAGAFADPHGGLGDLTARILRAVGDPSERFKEDALRALRAARFAARFGLTIEPSTADAIRAASALTGTLSGERIGAEIEGILAAGRAEIGLAALHDLGVMRVIAPALDAQWSHELPERVAAVGAPGSPDVPDPLGRLAELLTPISEDATVEQLLTRWRRPRATLAALAHLRAADRVATDAERGVTDAAEYRIRVAALTGDPRDAARQVRRRISAGRAASAAATLLAACEEADARNIPALPADLAVDGADLAAHLGVAPGAWIKRVQEALLVAIGRGEVKNQPAALLTVAERAYAQYE
ncbi:MAG: CCA tRNA nucleotidyltransferase, partial [Candidatus Limnocylindrus sp.]